MRSLKRLAPFLTPYRRGAIIAPLLMVLEVAMDLMLPRLMQRIIDQGVTAGDLKTFVRRKQGVADVANTPAILLAGTEQATLEGWRRLLAEVEVHVEVGHDLTDAVNKAIEFTPVLFVIDLNGWRDAWAFAKGMRSSRHCSASKILLVAQGDLSEREFSRAAEIRAQGFMRHDRVESGLAQEVKRLLAGGV